MRKKEKNDLKFSKTPRTGNDGYLLFLDDIRIPEDVGKYILPTELRLLYDFKEWTIVRNFDQFVSHIKFNGVPSIISFDHDLGEDEAIEKVSSGISKKKARLEKKESKSGYDCAKWLVDFCLKSGENLPEFLVHSMNPVGSQNIRDYLNNFVKFKEKGN